MSRHGRTEWGAFGPRHSWLGPVRPGLEPSPGGVEAGSSGSTARHRSNRSPSRPDVRGPGTRFAGRRGRRAPSDYDTWRSSPRSLTIDRSGCVVWEGHQLLHARTGIRRLESSQRFLDVDLSTLDSFQDREANGLFLHYRLRRFGSGIGRDVDLIGCPAHGGWSRFGW